jgi:hypothetical protein
MPPPTRGSAPKGAPKTSSTTLGDQTESHQEHTTEARNLVAAAERMLCHGLTTADVFTLDECATHAVVLLGKADRQLELASVAQ